MSKDRMKTSISILCAGAVLACICNLSQSVDTGVAAPAPSVDASMGAADLSLSSDADVPDSVAETVAPFATRTFKTLALLCEARKRQVGGTHCGVMKTWHGNIAGQRMKLAAIEWTKPECSAREVHDPPDPEWPYMSTHLSLSVQTPEGWVELPTMRAEVHSCSHAVVVSVSWEFALPKFPSHAPEASSDPWFEIMLTSRQQVTIYAHGCTGPDETEVDTDESDLVERQVDKILLQVLRDADGDWIVHERTVSTKRLPDLPLGHPLKDSQKSR